MLSILVLTCNQKEFTLRMAESLAPWMHANKDAELIIVDNASTDNTREALFKSGILPSERVNYLMQEKNLGVAAGRNIGLRAAKGDTILILDNDTEVNSAAIDGMLEHLRNNPDCGLCAPALYSASGELQDSAKPYPGLLIKASHLLRISNKIKSEKTAMESTHPCYVIGACQMFRKSIIDEIGWLDDNIFYGPEDADWCIRIAQSGKTIDYLHHLSIIHHWQRATRRSPLSRLSRLHFKALLYFYKKHARVF